MSGPDEHDAPPIRRVGIVGGGLAGLAAAETLARPYQRRPYQRRGGRIEVTVFEAKRHTGGRAGSFAMPDGRQADYCQHVAMGCCGELLGMIDRAGLSKFWQRYESLIFTHPSYPPSTFRPCKWLPPPLHLLPTIWAMKYLSVGEKLRLVAGIAKLLRSRPQRLIDVTASEWLAAAWQTDRLIRLFWNPILVSALGESVDKVSMSPARKTIVDGFAADRDAADVYVPRLPLSDMFGRRLTDHVRSLGIEIRTAVTVREIAQVNDWVNERADDRAAADVCGLRIECSGADQSSRAVDNAEGRPDRPFDAVIVAVPWHRATGLIGDGLSAVADDWSALSQIDGSPITGLHLWFDRPVLGVPHAVMLETVAQWVFASPTLWAGTDSAEANATELDAAANATGVDAAERHYVQVVISSRSPIIDRDQLVAQVCRELRELDSGVLAHGGREAELVDAKVVKDPRSVFSVTPSTERIRPPTSTAHPRVFLAGDVVATGWPATMEGAVISGQMAAWAVLDSIRDVDDTAVRGDEAGG